MSHYLKKALLVLMVTILCCGALAGCNGQNNTGSTEKETVSTSESGADATIKATKTNKDKKSSATDTKAIEQAIFKQVNAERKKAGKSQLKWNDTL
mgnify:CR=1 FL=1